MASAAVDPVEQRRRLELDAGRRSGGLPVYPQDSASCRRLHGHAPSAGVALGVDRLLMLLGDAEPSAMFCRSPWDEL